MSQRLGVGPIDSPIYRLEVGLSPREMRPFRDAGQLPVTVAEVKGHWIQPYISHFVS
jgi:hypothetical protein